MQPESLVKLVGSGNTATIEEEWMRLVENAACPPARIADYRVVLSELVRVGRSKMAEELAWTAIETVSSNHTPVAALTVMKPFLLAVSESDELRAQAVELYRTAHANRDGLEALLAEAGLGGGRPVRRALRTLDVCLTLAEGDFLAARDDEGAARVGRIDRGLWAFAITTERGAEELGAVDLADRYEPVAGTDFRVMRHFDSEALAERLQKDPVSVVISICKYLGNTINSDRLEMLLVPRELKAADWKKWWTRARTALKKCPNIRLDGRSPYTISYFDEPIALEDTVQEEFNKTRDPVAQLTLIEKYVRACKTCARAPSEEAMCRWYDHFRERAGRAAQQGNVTAGLLWVITRRLGELRGTDGAADEAVALFQTAPDLRALLQPIQTEALVDLACTCLVEARPDDWQDQLLDLLPTLPLPGCDRAAARLVEAGRGPADFAPVVQRILAAPVAHFEALLWLWGGPSNEECIIGHAPVTIMSRILRALEECRRSDAISKEAARTIAARARYILSTQKHERFRRCLETVGPEMAIALKTQIRRADNLGRAVREDLLAQIGRRFPALDSQPTIAPWAREDVIFVSGDGLVRKQQEIDHHVNVKMLKNARAIGEAASRGDLSENAEYKFALEERDLLRARLAQMNAEMAKAERIDPAKIPTDHIGIGTKAMFQRADDGLRYEMSFVGPWDADADAGRYNYLAPLSQKLMGSRIGDSVEFDHAGATGTYEVVALEKAIFG